MTYATLPAGERRCRRCRWVQAGAYVAVDVTALVQGWVTAPATNNGLALTAATAVVQFDSKENDLTGHAAVLDVALASGGAGGGDGATGPRGLRDRGRPELRGRLELAGLGTSGAPGLSFRGPMRQGRSMRCTMW